MKGHNPMETNSLAQYSDETSTRNAWIGLSVILVLVACLIAASLVGMRGINVGTDTHEYAGFFETIANGRSETRFEPGFVLVTRLLAATGIGVIAYQWALFGILLLTVWVASRRYFDYLGGERGYLTFLTASLAFLFVSPMFVNAAINAVRQGLASLLVFAALLAFHRRQWRAFIGFGILATGFHYSALLYLACAPVLLLGIRSMRIIALLGFLAYCTGLTMVVVRSAVPALYVAVMSYSPEATYRAGVRIDFAVFSIFWYMLPYLMSGLVREPFRQRIKDSTAVYLVMLLPFFLVGWGNYSNRYLLPAYLTASLIVAAIFCNGRTPFLRNPLLLRAGLIVSSFVFCYYVTYQVIV